jgi:hypothetical protein
MPPRLLSFLSAVEHALVANAYSGVDQRPERFVNYQKGIARMTFRDGSGSLTLQNFTLADGQICIKAEFSWSKSQLFGSQSVFPTMEDFNWPLAASKVADGWLAGLPAVDESLAFDGAGQLSAAS